MKDETIHKAEPINGHFINKHTFEEVIKVIGIVLLIILLIWLLTKYKGGAGIALGLAEILTMVEL